MEIIVDMSGLGTTDADMRQKASGVLNTKHGPSGYTITGTRYEAKTKSATITYDLTGKAFNPQMGHQ